MTRAKGAALLAAAALAGCGGGADAGEVVSETGSKLGGIRSGDLTLELDLRPRGIDDARQGFSLRGPFAAREGGLPLADVAYTQRTGDQDASARIVSTGRAAFSCADGRPVRLPASAERGLRDAAAGLGEGGRGPFGGVDLAAWIRDAEVTDGEQEGTDRVTGELDVVRAINDLRPLAGDRLPSVEGATADDLRKAVRTADVELVSGSEDRLLRRLRVAVDVDLPASLRRQTGGLTGATFSLTVAVGRPNARIAAPDPAKACAG